MKKTKQCSMNVCHIGDIFIHKGTGDAYVLVGYWVGHKNKNLKVELESLDINPSIRTDGIRN